MKASEKKEQGYCSLAVGAFIVVLIVEWLWPDVIPFTMFQFWKLNGNLVDIVKMSWPVFAWGTGVSFLILVLKGVDYEERENAEKNFVVGFLTSLWAGVFEEISFRWLIFMDEIIGYKIVNWLFFGWAGFGMFEWIFLHISGPIANFFTLGYLSPILFNGFGWAVGSAILSSNGKFRDGHAYQGLLGFINSWFIGMFMFYLMFTYGLIASIVVHFLYDLFIDIVRYLIAISARGLSRL
jgi:hypothetical protein